MKNQGQLNRLANEFQRWRLTRKYRREKTPKRLKDKNSA